jgi:hypothetical protein
MEEDVVLNTVIVFLDSINWLIFVTTTSVCSGRYRRRSELSIRTSSYDGLCMPYLEFCFPQPRPNAADV